MISIPTAAHSFMSRLCAYAISFVSLTAALAAQQAGPSPIKIYIMVGQSNMVGHGDISPVGTQGTLEYIVANEPATYGFLKEGGNWKVRDDVWFINEAKSTSDLTTGLGANSNKIGPELGFGHVIGDHQGNQVFIIKPSWGGKSLAVDFRPPSSGGTTGYFYNLMTDIIDDAVANLGTYFPDYDGQGYEFAGFCWHQGYNDRVTPGFDTQYETNMANFINDIRDHLNVPDLPFVIATTGMGGGTTTTIVENAQLEMLNATKYPEFAGNVAVIDTRNTTYLGQSYWQAVANSPANEGHHWNRNAMTYLHIGMAMGDAMAALPGPECPSRLEAVGDASGVTLTWQNGSEIPTSVQILRNGVEIAAAAPVVPASFVDTTAQPGVLDYELVFTMPTATCDPLTVSFDAGITELIGYRAATGVALQWKNNLGYTNIEVRRDNVPLATIAGTSTTYTDTTAPSTGSFTYSVVPTNGSAEETEVVVNLGPPSAGSALVYEPFDYAIGGLNTQSGSSETGLSGTWGANGTTLVVPGSLTYSSLPTFGGSIGDLTLGQNRYGGARAISASALSSGGYLNDGATLWFSAVVGLQTGGNGTNARLGLALANDQFNGANYKYWINDDGTQLGEGVGITLVGNGGRVLATQFQDFASGDNIAGNVLGNWTGAGTTYQSGEYGLIVGKIVWGAGATDTIEIFHPGQDMLLPATASSTLVVDVDQSLFDTITFARSDKVLLDEIRFGASYEAVVGASVTPDIDPPTPNPAAFSVAPTADSDSAISMTAVTGTDISGPVEYLFTETSGNTGGTSSAWQTSANYIDSGLQASTTYSYTVTMRDSLGNTGTASASVDASTLAIDNTPPTPNPMTFATAPYAISSTAITMTATTATDDNYGVEYYFDETSSNPGGSDSGWQSSPTYTDTGLDPSTLYTYTVRARDTSPNQNEGTASGPESTSTLTPDTTAPTPNPMTWASPPSAISSTQITMTATTASDPSGVEYYFTCTSGGGHNSGWQNSPSYTDTGLSPSTTYAYEVKARDKSPGQNETAASSPPASATTDAAGVSSLVQSGWSFLHSQNVAPGNTHNISVHPGSSGYAGTNASGGATSGTFGDGTVEAYNFFSADAGGNGFNNGNETIVSYAQGGSPITGSTTDTTLNIGSATKLWTSTDPAGFTTTANFTTNTNATEVSNFSGTIDISGYSSGHIYFIYGHYRGGVADNFLSLTMKDTQAVAPDIQLPGAGTGDVPNNWEHYLVDIAFVNASGYDTIVYSFNFAGNGRVGGIVLDGVSTGGPGSPYTTWASTNAPSGDPDDDFDADGVSNAVEFVLGGDKDTNDLGKLPTAAASANDMTFTFERDETSVDDSVDVTIEVSNDLVIWTAGSSPYSVPDADTEGVANPGVTVVDNGDTHTVTLTIPKTPDTRKFARLKVVITP